MYTTHTFARILTTVLVLLSVSARADGPPQRGDDGVLGNPAPRISPALDPQSAAWTEYEGRAGVPLFTGDATALSSTVAPTARYAHAMAYDSRRGVTVLFGGWVRVRVDRYEPSQETWEWDGHAWTLRDVAGPYGRADHAMAYDSIRGVTVLFGGGGYYINGDDGARETWEWDGAAWTLRSITGPAGRRKHKMAFDSARGRTVLFGGENASGKIVGDTWEWDGATWALTDPGRPDCVADADCDDGNVCTDDHCTNGECAHAFNNAPCDGGWECVTAAVCLVRTQGTYIDGLCTPTAYVPNCAPRMFASVVAVNGVPIVPTETVEVARGDKVTLDVFVENWFPNNAERTLKLAQGSIDPAGFTSGSGGALALLSDPTPEAGLFQDVNRPDWIFPGAGVLSLCDTTPSSPRCAALVLDDTDCRADPGVPSYLFTAILVVSADASGTFTITAGEPFWQSFIAACASGAPVGLLVEPSSVKIRIRADFNANGVADSPDIADGTSADRNGNPAPRINPALVPQSPAWTEYERRAGVPLFKGGAAALSGTVAPTPRENHAMGCDSRRGVTVLFGGWARVGVNMYERSQETWEWDGHAWTLRDVPGPLGRRKHAMAYDSTRGVTVLFGGGGQVFDGTSYTLGYNYDTWEWDGTAWTLRSVTGPVGRLEHTMAFDSARGRTVLFGGYNASGKPVGDTWEWDGATWALTDPGRPDCFADAECDDGNACTDDHCTNGECANAYNNAPCDDGSECITAAVCTDARCTPTAYVPNCAPRMFASVVAIDGVPIVPTETVEVARGDKVTLDVFVENWSPNNGDRTLKIAQGSIDPAGFTNGSEGALALLSDPTREAGLFQDVNRPDWIFPGVQAISLCNGSSSDAPMCAALVLDDRSCRADPGVPSYLFTAVLVVSDDASGTFTVTVGRPIWQSFIVACTSGEPVGLPVEPSSVEIRIGADCNDNGVVDSRDIFDGTSADCNGNAAPDECDLATGFSPDVNNNGIPDECEQASSALPDPNGMNKNRSLAFSVQAPATAGPGPHTALRVRLVDLQNPNPPNLPTSPPPNFSAYESATCNAPGEMNGCARWVGKPGTFLESQDNPAQGTFKASRLQCTPYYHDFSADGLIHVVGAEIVASSTYEVESLAAMCRGVEDTCTAVSAPLIITTARFGDIAAPFNPPATSTQPDAIDVTQLVNKFKNVPGAPSKAITQLQPNLPELNADINALDIVAVVDAVKQFAYAFSGPCACPSTVTCGPAMGSVACTTPTVCVTAFGTGATCVKTCNGGANADDPCINNTHCAGSSTCGSGFCRDRCGRCNP